MDLISLALRHVGRRVRISLHGHQKVEGVLEGVHDDCFRIGGALTLDELDDQGWYSKLRDSDPDFNCGPRDPETLIHIHSIMAITCTDEDLEPPEASGERRADSVSDVIILPEDDPVRETEEEAWQQLLNVDRVALEIGAGLISLATDDTATGLLKRISMGRKELADQVGLVAPAVRIRDNIQLGPFEYRVLISECEISRSSVRPDRKLALGGDSSDFGIDGEPYVEPVFGLPAFWIDANDSSAAELAGWSVFDVQSAIVTHLLDLMRQHAADLLTYEQVAELVRRFRAVAPQLVHEVVPAVVSLRTLHAILRRLLEERVSIRNVAAILECLGQESTQSDNVEALLAKTRVRLGRELCRPLKDPETGQLRVVEFSSKLSARVREAPTSASWLPQLAFEVKERLRSIGEPNRGESALLVDADLRTNIYQVLNCRPPRVPVLSYAEIPCRQEVEVVSIIALDSLAASGGGDSNSTGPRRETLLSQKAPN